MTRPEDDIARAMRPVRLQLQEVEHSFRSMAKALLPPLRAFAAQLQVVGEAIEETTWRAYRDAGSPYGPTREGKWRWLRELAKAERMRAEADEIEAWHRALAILREKIEASQRAEEKR